jgi:hypothetical protein
MTCIPMLDLRAPVVVVPLQDAQKDPCFFVVSCDTEGPEPEYWQTEEDST